MPRCSPPAPRACQHRRPLFNSFLGGMAGAVRRARRRPGFLDPHYQPAGCQRGWSNSRPAAWRRAQCAVAGMAIHSAESLRDRHTPPQSEHSWPTTVRRRCRMNYESCIVRHGYDGIDPFRLAAHRHPLPGDGLRRHGHTYRDWPVSRYPVLTRIARGPFSSTRRATWIRLAPVRPFNCRASEPRADAGLVVPSEPRDRPVGRSTPGGPALASSPQSLRAHSSSPASYSIGAPRGIRTPDRLLRRQLLCPLS